MVPTRKIDETPLRPWDIQVLKTAGEAIAHQRATSGGSEIDWRYSALAQAYGPPGVTQWAKMSDFERTVALASA